MKITIPTALLLCSLATMVACNKNHSLETQPNAPIVGGYTAISTADKGAIDAANKAILIKASEMKDTTLELVRITSAQQQIVAGVNYALSLQVKSNGKVENIDAVVWWQAWNQESPYKVTAWNVK